MGAEVIRRSISLIFENGIFEGTIFVTFHSEHLIGACVMYCKVTESDYI